jgi:hypothetical protein
MRGHHGGIKPRADRRHLRYANASPTKLWAIEELAHTVPPLSQCESTEKDHQGKDERIPLQLSPAVIVIGYVLALFAVVAAAVAFPFSIISMVLLFIVVGAFFVLVVPILLMVCLFFTIALYRAMMAFGRRLVAGAGHDAESPTVCYPSLLKNDVAPEQIDMGLWDRWIDGAR